MSPTPLYEDIYVLHSIIRGYLCPPLHYTRIFMSSTPLYEDIHVLHSIIRGYSCPTDSILRPALLVKTQALKGTDANFK